MIDLTTIRSASFAALAGVSVFALAACGGDGGSEEKSSEEQAEEVREEAEEMAQETREAAANVRDEAEDAADEAGEALSEAAEGAREAGDEARDAANDAMDGAKAAASDMKAAASDAMQKAEDTAKQAAGDMKDAAAGAAASAAGAAQSAAGAVSDAAREAYTNLTGDPQAGRRVFTKCMACHVVQEGVNRVGPSLYNIVGREAGKVDGFRYSDANANSGITWTEPVLFVYLEDPQGYLPGTKMAFPGLPKAQDRADVIAYLKSASE
ncbi:MAG: cytochrome c family protein [Pseudomonadota bacterium]